MLFDFFCCCRLKDVFRKPRICNRHILSSARRQFPVANLAFINNGSYISFKGSEICFHLDLTADITIVFLV